MSSSAGQESRVDSQVSRALEAAKNPFLRKIAERFQKEPNQIWRISEILGFTNEEEKNTKALIWLKKHEPDRYQSVLQASEVKNKKMEGKEMRPVFQKLKGKRVKIYVVGSHGREVWDGTVKKAGRECVELETQGINVFINYCQIISVY